MRRKSRGDPGDRQRQQRLRDRRRADGWRRVSIWLSPEQVARLAQHGGAEGLGRTVKRLLAWADPALGADNALDNGARVADHPPLRYSITHHQPHLKSPLRRYPVPCRVRYGITTVMATRTFDQSPAVGS